VVVGEGGGAWYRRRSAREVWWLVRGVCAWYRRSVREVWGDMELEEVWCLVIEEVWCLVIEEV
jgi:hypothetical protein